MKKWVATMVVYCCFFLGGFAQEWAPLEEGFTGPPSELFNDTDTSLIVMGGFSGTANGMFADGIVRWNGNEWEAFDDSVFGYSVWDDGAFWDIEVFQDELYVSGPFLVIDYDYEYFYYLAKYSGPHSLVLNTNNQAASASTKVYPNPAADVITLESRQFLNQAAELVCCDALGRELLRTTWPQGNLQFTLNLGHLKAGLYFMVIETEMGIETHRFIKE